MKTLPSEAKQKRVAASRDTPSDGSATAAAANSRDGPPLKHALEELSLDHETAQRMRQLPLSIGWLLVTAGVVIPSVLGMPFLVWGGLMLPPGTARRAECWLSGDAPRLFKDSICQVNRFLDDIERRYPAVWDAITAVLKAPAPAPLLQPDVTRRHRRIAGLFAVLVSCHAVAIGNAAADPLDAATEQYHNDRRRLISENLSLTAAEARRFWPLYERYEKDLFVLTGRRQAIITKFGENYDAMTDAMAREILLERLTIEDERHRLRRIYLPRFERVLPIKKLARFFQIESKIRAAVEAGIAEELPLIK